MITWILGPILIVWVIIKRASKDGRVEDYPLGMPRGTVRAIITIMVVAFPFNYLLIGQPIPGAITNAIFILVAFYFEARKSGQEKIKLIKAIKSPEKVAEEERKEKKPLYLPKYTVRSILVILLIATVMINFYGPNVPFEITNTLLDIVVIIAFYFIGSLFRTIGVSKQKKKLKRQVQAIPNYESLSKYEIIDKIMEQTPSFWKRTWRSIISIITFFAVTTGLILFTLDLDYTILLFGLFEPSLREALLLLINVYYGFRD